MSNDDIERYQEGYFYSKKSSRVVIRRKFVSATNSWYINVWRASNRAPTFQGTICPGQEGWWLAYGALRGNPDEKMLGMYTDISDAEHALLRHKSGVTSRVEWAGPRPALDPKGNSCPICGHKLKMDVCSHEHLHVV